MEVDHKELLKLAHRLGEILQEKNYSIASAESCTGGWLAHVLTSVPSCSSVFERGYVTYSEKSKISLLNVRPETIEKYGIVSKAVAEEMAVGTLHHSMAQVSLSVTGTAGPTQNDPEVPIGTCWFGWTILEETYAECRHFSGDRIVINYQAVKFSMSQLIHYL